MNAGYRWLAGTPRAAEIPGTSRAGPKPTPAAAEATLWRLRSAPKAIMPLLATGCMAMGAGMHGGVGMPGAAHEGAVSDSPGPTTTVIKESAQRGVVVTVKVELHAAGAPMRIRATITDSASERRITDADARATVQAPGDSAARVAHGAAHAPTPVPAAPPVGTLAPAITPDGEFVFNAATSTPGLYSVAVRIGRVDGMSVDPPIVVAQTVDVPAPRAMRQGSSLTGSLRSLLVLAGVGVLMAVMMLGVAR